MDREAWRAAVQGDRVTALVEPEPQRESVHHDGRSYMLH